MIYTCTLNPAVDKIGTVNQIEKNKVHRLVHVESDAGGKGINVSRDIKILHYHSVAVGFLGGSSGTFINMLLQRENIDHHMIDIIGNTRTNLKIYDGEGVCEFNEEGPFILNDEMEALFDYFKSHLNVRSLLVISGSMPKGCSSNTYRRLCEIAHENKARVFMNTSIHYLKEVLCEKPDIIKISATDLASYFGIDAILEEKEVIQKGMMFVKEHCYCLCVTSVNGVYVLTEDEQYHCKAIDLEIKSRVGVGDAFVAGLSVGIDRDDSLMDAIRLGGACYCAASQRINAHPKNYEEVEQYLPLIQVEAI